MRDCSRHRDPTVEKIITARYTQTYLHRYKSCKHPFIDLPKYLCIASQQFIPIPTNRLSVSHLHIKPLCFTYSPSGLAFFCPQSPHTYYNLSTDMKSPWVRP